MLLLVRHQANRESLTVARRVRQRAIDDLLTNFTLLRLERFPEPAAVSNGAGREINRASARGQRFDGTLLGPFPPRSRSRR